MKYVALLRGINVGGNNIIKMVDLKKCLEEAEYENVVTFIQSGNVIFDSTEKNISTLTTHLEKILSHTFSYQASVMVRSLAQLKKVVAEVPKEWKSSTDLRCYIAFLKDKTTPQTVMKEIELKKDIDSMKAGESVIYMTTLLSARTQSSFTKLVGKKIYKEMTIRNYTTTLKLLALMEK
jgi:uncharacterized protein (DUF1697 family)